VLGSRVEAPVFNQVPLPFDGSLAKCNCWCRAWPKSLLDEAEAANSLADAAKRALGDNKDDRAGQGRPRESMPRRDDAIWPLASDSKVAIPASCRSRMALSGLSDISLAAGFSVCA
jgi:hypothetical protein